MKFLKQISFILLFFCLACSKREDNSLHITIDMVVNYADSMHIYYTENTSIKFSEEKSFWKKVKANKKNQKIDIVFPPNKSPKQIRIDFGNNVKNQDIILNEISLSRNKKDFNFKGKEIFNYFRVDQNNTFFNYEKGCLNRLNKKNKKGPSLYPKGDKLYNKLLFLEKNVE